MEQHQSRNSNSGDRTGICLGTDMAIFAYYFSINNSFAPYLDVQAGSLTSWSCVASPHSCHRASTSVYRFICSFLGLASWLLPIATLSVPAKTMNYRDGKRDGPVEDLFTKGYYL